MKAEELVIMFLLIVTSIFGIIMGMAFFGYGLLIGNFIIVLVGILGGFAGIIAAISLFAKVLK